MGYIKDLKDQALATLKGKWGSFVGITFIYMLLYGIACCLMLYGTVFGGSSFKTLAIVFTIIGAIVSVLFIPIQYGYYIAHLNSSRQDLPADIGDLFIGYKRFWHVIGTYLLMMVVFMVAAFPLIIMGVLSAVYANTTAGLIIQGVLFFFEIPVIILALAYSMVTFILYDDEELSAKEILTKSRMMMRDHKGELFLLMLSFIGWMFLCVFTFGIGMFWLMPYMQMTITKFYEQIRAEYESVGEENEPVVMNEPVEEAAPVEDAE